MNDYNSVRRLFDLYRQLTGEDLMPIKTADKTRPDGKK
jgi:hypothetical protein